MSSHNIEARSASTLEVVELGLSVQILMKIEPEAHHY